MEEGERGGQRSGNDAGKWESKGIAEILNAGEEECLCTKSGSHMG